MLLERGHEVLVLGRSAPKEKQAKLSFLECDLNQISESAATAVAEFRPEACLHLAWQGIPDYSPENCHRNFNAAFGLFQLVLKNGCRKVVGAGSCWEYGELRGRVSEDAQPRELSAFAAYKTATRLVLESLCRPLGARAAWARVFFVYGPGQRAEALIPSTLRKVKESKPVEIRSPNAQNDFVYVGDVARGMVLLLEAPTAWGVYNLGTGEATRVGDVVKEIQRAAGVNELDFQREDRPQESFWSDISRMKKEMGWQSEVALREGLASVFNEFP
jgi:nucleoside-diphosphate-sugar epimerase